MKAPFTPKGGLLCTMLIVFSGSASSSGVSDIFGVNWDIPAGKFEIGTPNLGALPRVIQNLPRDAANFYLNPFGPPLAFLIRQTEANAARSARPIPPQIRQMLVPFFPPNILDQARWTTAAESGVNLNSQLEQINGNIAAMTANTIIVFRGPTEAQEVWLWAHELVHVTQYQNMGIEGFAAMYAGWGAQQIENDAYAYEGHVMHVLNSFPVVAPAQLGQQLASIPQQWSMTRPPAQPLEWSTIHEYALRVIPANQCVQRVKSNDPSRLRIRNVCAMGLELVTIHTEDDEYDCIGDDCYFPPGDEHTVQDDWPSEVTSADFQFLNSIAARMKYPARAHP
jgi:hypothetical protein